jgi:WD40 repeat protein
LGEETFEYKTFISYSHRDTKWAQWLLHALETYRLPDSKVRGVGRVFRDRDEAGAASDLKDEIQRALAVSEHLIVIASPRSARSKYVQAEIEFFAAHNATRAIPGRILTLIVDGEPNTSSPELDDPRECFPPALRGGVRKPDGSPLEPLAADARAVGDGKTRALAKLVSGLMDIRYDTLVRRDLQRRRRTRMLAGASMLAALALSGAVGAVIVNGNLEQGRLREARESAERDARTVTAVSIAERARRSFETGNLQGAVELARSSLPDDGTLPFIPQAYSVLYGALFQAGAPVGLNFGYSYRTTAPFLMANGDFVTVQDSTATVWSVARGVVFVRDDLSALDPPTAAPDGSALFVKSSVDLLRYRSETRSWDKLADFDAVIGNDDLGDVPDRYAALNVSAVAGCDGPVFTVISFPAAGDGPGRSDLTRTLDDDCDAIGVTDDGNVLLLMSGGDIAEMNPATGELGTTRSPTGEFSLEWVKAVGDVIVAGSIGKTFAFKRSTGEIIVSFEDSTTPSALNTSGRYLLEPGILSGADGAVIHDLASRTRTKLNCELCGTIGFLPDETILMLGRDNREVQTFDPLTGQQIGALTTFDPAVEAADILADGTTLLGYRSVGAHAAISLKRKSRDNQIVGTPAPFLVSAIFAGKSTVVVQEEDGSGSIPMRTVLRLYEASPNGRRIENAALDELGTVSDVFRLENDLFGVFAGDIIFSASGPLRVYDANSGDLVLREDLTAPPHRFAGGRFVLLAGEAAFSVFDAASRQIEVLDAGTGASGSGVWSISDRALAVVDGDRARVFSLSLKGAELTHEIQLPGIPLFACVTDSGQQLYVLDFSTENIFVARIDLDGGKVTERHQFDIDFDQPGDLATILGGLAIAHRSLPNLVCTDDDVVLRDELAGLAAIWTPAADTVETMPLAQADPASPPTDDAVAGPVDLSRIEGAEAGHSDTTVWLRDPTSGEMLVAIPTERSRIATSAWLPQSGLIAVGLDDGRLQVWDVTAPSATMIDIVAHSQNIDTIDVSPDGSQLLTSVSGGAVKLWPLLTPRELLAETSTLVE